MTFDTTQQQPEKHLGKSRQYWRDMILGVNDGLVSTFLLVAGVAGGGLTSQDILLTAVAGAIAGAISMSAGEYVATKSQNEVMEGELILERKHIRDQMEDEMEELSLLLDKIGLPGGSSDGRDGTIEGGVDEFAREEEDEEDLNSQSKTEERNRRIRLKNDIMAFYRDHPDSLMKIMQTLEFGIIDEEVRSPVKAAALSGLLFILGSLPSVIPFAFSGDRPGVGLIVAGCATVMALILIGAIKTWATRGKCFMAAVENLVIAGVGGGFAYGVGVMFENIIRK